MSRQKKPGYWSHKPNGRAYVRIDGKDHYLCPPKAVIGMTNLTLPPFLVQLLCEFFFFAGPSASRVRLRRRLGLHWCIWG